MQTCNIDRPADWFLLCELEARSPVATKQKQPVSEANRTRWRDLLQYDARSPTITSVSVFVSIFFLMARCLISL